MIKKSKYTRIIAIILVLLGPVFAVRFWIATPPNIYANQRAKVLATNITFKEIISMIKLYDLEHKRLPQSLQQLRDQKYIKKVPSDAWGNKINYELSTDKQSIKIVSYGADGLPGGAEENQDLEVTYEVKKDISSEKE